MWNPVKTRLEADLSPAEIDRDFQELDALLRLLVTRPKTSGLVLLLEEATPPRQGAGPSTNGVVTMKHFLLDCNHLSSAIRKVSATRERIHQARKDGCKFATCVPVICELESGDSPDR